MRKKSKVGAGLLALFLGFLGIHRFYLQQPILGFIYLFLMFFGISPILGIIDAIVILSRSQESFDRKYNKKWYQKGFLHKNRYPTKGRSKTSASSRSEQHKKMKAKKQKLQQLKEEGKQKFTQYDIQEAIEAFERALEMHADDIATHFNLACAYSLRENAEKAKMHLATAFDLGFDDYEKVRTHRSLAYIRTRNDWPAFIANYQQQQAQLPPGERGNVFDQLKKLAELRQQGVLTEEEYIEKKDHLLQRKTPS